MFYHSLAVQPPLYHNRPEQHLHYCWWSPNPSVHLSLQPAITREQDPEILKLLCLRQELIFKLILAASHSVTNCSSVRWRSWLEKAKRTTLSTKSRDATLRFPHQMPSSPWLRLEILSMRITNRIVTKGSLGIQHANEFNLQPRMWTQLSLWSYSDRIAPGRHTLPGWSNSHESLSYSVRVKIRSSVPRPGWKPLCSSWIRRLTIGQSPLQHPGVNFPGGWVVVGHKCGRSGLVGGSEPGVCEPKTNFLPKVAKKNPKIPSFLFF